MTEPHIPQPRDENGQFISITTLFERERQEHGKDHDREHIVAGETARRLEREVEETARRLERMVEETASRLEQGVAKALDAVSATAQVHSEAHQREHVAHERIHSVEKDQLDKEEGKKRDEQLRLAADLKEYKASANEWRASLADQSNRFTTRDMFDQRTEAVDGRVSALEKMIVGREAFEQRTQGVDDRVTKLEKDNLTRETFSVALESRDAQLDILNNWKSKATGAAVILTLVAGTIGAAVMKIFS